MERSGSGPYVRPVRSRWTDTEFRCVLMRNVGTKDTDRMSNQMRGLDFDLGESADMLRNAVESFAADEIAPRAAAIDAANEFPADLWPKLGSIGLLGVTVTEEYGGAGMG